MKTKKLISLSCLTTLLIGGGMTTSPSLFAQTETKAESTAASLPSTPLLDRHHMKEPTQLTIDPKKKYEALITTSKGDIKVSLNAEKAPWSVNNFVYLAKAGFYDGLTFHRVEPNFVIQGGDPEGTGRGGPGYTVKAEIGLKHSKGALAWARTGDSINPERRSSGSQFYICLDAQPFLDNQYTVFGQTLEGMDVVSKISVGDVIQKVTVVEQ